MKLSSREKKVISAGGGILLVFFVYTFILIPQMDRSRLLDRLIAQKADSLKEMEKLKKIHFVQQEAIQRIAKKLANSKKNFAILSFLEETAKKVGIKRNIAKMKPYKSHINDKIKESSVQLKVDGIGLSQLVDYLYYIENSQTIINVKKLRIKKRKKERHLIDVTIDVSTFEPSG